MEIPVIIKITEEEINFIFPDLSVCKEMTLTSEGNKAKAQLHLDLSYMKELMIT